MAVDITFVFVQSATTGERKPPIEYLKKVKKVKQSFIMQGKLFIIDPMKGSSTLLLWVGGNLPVYLKKLHKNNRSWGFLN